MFVENFIRSTIVSILALVLGTASLPAPWKQQDIGAVAVHGQTNYDGVKFIIKAAGNATDSTKDEFHFAYFPLESEGEITARLVPQPGSRFSKMGLMMRESLVVNSIFASLILNPGKSGKIEAPKWQSMLVSRSTAGKPMQVKNTGHELSEPIVTSGGLTGEYWLRLVRKYNSFYAFTSLDGKTWTLLGSTFVEMKKKFFAGIAVSSGVKDVTTTVMFDNITIPGWKSGE